MITFAHIEDYLEVLGGYREITTYRSSPGPTNIFGGITSPIALARYDVAIIRSMSGSTVAGVSLTDKQSELAVKLVDKYKRQFASKGVDVLPSVQNPQFRLNVRIIDRTKAAFIRNGKIILRFPYDKILVPLVTTAAKESRGSFKFDREAKEWQLAITESNVNWAASLAQYDFSVDKELVKLMQLILDCENTDYKIELVAVNGTVDIVNAEPSLRQYIDRCLGGMTSDNLIKLVDNGPLLGYTVNDDIKNVMAQEFDAITLGLLLNKESHVMRVDPLSDGEELLEPMFRYAELTQRWPICIYEPDASNRLRNTAQGLFRPEEFLDTTDKKSFTEVDLSRVKCVYFNKLKRSWRYPVPILVSTNAMLYGGEKQAMLQSAEKVVYYTATTYDKEATTIAGKVNN
jgi:hypothetical protein